MLDFRMETFLEVCKGLNFTKTARRLNMTQPAVSQHIHWLEKAYGARLFSYQGKKMSLTPAGELLKNSAATMSHDILLLREKMQEITREKRELKIGLTLTIAEFEAAKSMAKYLTANESYSMLLSVGNTRELLKELEEGAIDFALVEGNFPRDTYHHQLYATEPYIAVCASDDSLARGCHTIDELLGRRLVTREAGSGTRNILERYLEMKSLEVTDFSALVEAGSIGLIKQLVEYGCGITFLYRMAVMSELEEGSLCEIKMDDMNITHDFTFIWREGSIFYEDYQKIYQMLKKSREKSTEE